MNISQKLTALGSFFYLPAIVISTLVACNTGEEAMQPMSLQSSSTCDGNDDGWYCYTNSDLNVASGDEFYDTDLIHCENGAVTTVKACTDVCQVRPSGVNDACGTKASVTCDGNADGWYCYTNSDLNVASGDEFYDTDLIHCENGAVSEVKACSDSCDVRPSGMNDVCVTGGSSSTCDGNDDGWYCYTNPVLNVASGDEYYDTDLIHCLNGSVTQVQSCIAGCEVKAQGVNDQCADENTQPVCGNGLIETGEACDLLNMNGQTCQSLGSDGGTLVCNSSCQFDSSACCDHSCTGTTQCIGTTKQTCQDSNGDGCNEWVNTGTCPPDEVCGNGQIEGSEVCDSGNLNGHTCQSEGYDGGTVSCSSCSLNTSSCCQDSCDGTTQCVNNIEQTCQTGSSGCKEWVTTGSCAPTCTTEIASNSCYTYTSSTGLPYEIFEVCAEKVSANRITMHVRKNPASSFGSRPYGAKVSGLSDPDCSHSTYYYNDPTGGVSVTGIGTNDLKLTFDVTWASGQTDKKYCAYASTISSDQGYDSSDPSQEIWWYSRSLRVQKVCN